MARPKSFDDYPTSPVPAWKHYQIIKEVEKKIRKRLKEMEYKGYLIGLSVGYTLVRADKKSNEVGQEYTMSFGYGVKDVKEFAREKNPLDQEFVTDLLHDIQRWIENNTDIPGDYRVELNISISGSYYYYGIKCDILRAGQCGGDPNKNNQKCPVGDRRVLYDDGSGWKCTHSPC